MPRRASLTGAWLGLLAIALHVFGPFVGPALYGAPAEAAGHSHDHAVASRQHEADAHAFPSEHHHRAPDAQDAPLSPDQICIGDCPCCSLGERSLPLVTRALSLLQPAERTRDWIDPTPASLRVFSPAAHSRPRAPPIFA